MLSPKNIFRRLHQCFAIIVSALLFFPPATLLAVAPTWWAEQNVLTPGVAADDYAALNQGQLKNLAQKAVLAMDAKMEGGAGATLHALVAGWSTPRASTDDYAVANLGQLKAVAKPFYDRLIAAGAVSRYPWTNAPTPPDDYAVANLGQAKNLFSFTIPKQSATPDMTTDTDGDGIPDYWEKILGSNPNVVDNYTTGTADCRFTVQQRYDMITAGFYDPVTLCSAAGGLPAPTRIPFFENFDSYNLFNPGLGGFYEWYDVPVCGQGGWLPINSHLDVGYAFLYTINTYSEYPVLPSLGFVMMVSGGAGTKRLFSELPEKSEVSFYALRTWTSSLNSGANDKFENNVIFNFNGMRLALTDKLRAWDDGLKQWRLVEMLQGSNKWLDLSGRENGGFGKITLKLNTQTNLYTVQVDDGPISSPLRLTPDNAESHQMKFGCGSSGGTLMIDDISVQKRTGHIENIDNPSPENTDTDGDGIPDYWEIILGLNPFDASDAAGDPAGTGYTWRQRYDAMISGGTDPVTRKTLVDFAAAGGNPGGGSSSGENPSVKAPVDSDGDGYSDYIESYLGHGTENKGDHPNVRYAIIDIGDDTPIAISKENAWMMSRRARWHAGGWDMQYPADFWARDINSSGCILGIGDCDVVGRGYYINADGSKQYIAVPNMPGRDQWDPVWPHHFREKGAPGIDSGIAWGFWFVGEDRMINLADGFGDYLEKHYLLAPTGCWLDSLGSSSSDGHYLHVHFIDHTEPCVGITSAAIFNRNGDTAIVGTVPPTYPNDDKITVVPSPNYPCVKESHPGLISYSGVRCYALNNDLMAVGNRSNTPHIDYTKPLLCSDGEIKDLPQRTLGNGGNTGAAYLITNKQTDENYIIASAKHIWECERDESGDVRKPIKFKEPEMLSALIHWDSGWTDNWNITGLNDAGLIIGTGYKIKEGAEAYTKDTGELIIDFKDPHYSTYTETANPYNDYVKKEYIPTGAIEKRGFLMVPLKIATDRNRDGKIDLENGTDVYGRALPFRFWEAETSDDKDVEEWVGSQPGGMTTLTKIVHGMPDLQNFFPLWMNLKECMLLFPPESFDYIIKSPFQISAVGTSLGAGDSMAYLRKLPIADQYKNNEVKQGTEIKLNDLTCPTGRWLDLVRGDSGGIMLIRCDGESPGIATGKITAYPKLVIRHKAGQKEFMEEKIYISVSKVDDMYRELNLRDCASMTREDAKASGKDKGEKAEANEPVNWPDKFYKDQWFVFSHGYNVNEEDAKKGNRQVFKRMFWSGMDAKMVGLSWFGDPNGWGFFVRDYHQAVINAFKTSSSAAAALLEFPGKRVLAAHSLGNGLLGFALCHDEIFPEGTGANLDASSYFMLDAAMSQEAYDAGAAQTSAMLGNGDYSPYLLYSGGSLTDKTLTDNRTIFNWQGYSKVKDEKLLSSEWHTLFTDSGDPRSKLTWRGILSSVSKCNVYNLYSSSEEVLAAYAGNSMTNGDIFGVPVPIAPATFSWAKQEKFKGDKRTYITDGVAQLGGAWCGYGFNKTERRWQEEPVRLINDYTNTWTGVTMSIANADKSNFLTARRMQIPSEISLQNQDELKTKPFFLANPSKLFNSNESNAKQFAKENRHELLAKGFPARTLPAGANAFSFEFAKQHPSAKSHDMAGEFKTDDSRWPRQGQDQQTEKWNSWYHSDFKNIAYPHNYKLYDFIVEKGELK